MPIRRDGPVLMATRRNLIAGIRANPLTPAATDVIIEQAADFVQKFVSAYETEVAGGEVGVDGSARASDTEPIAGTCPTALLYGRVQSGKTNAMIVAAALALDNGFRTVVVVTANNVALVHQTANRFKALAGPRVFSTAVEGEYEWEGQLEDLRDDIREDGLVLVCAKDATHLPEVVGLFQALDAAAFPALILDDEADAATPDTTLAARSAGRPNAPAVPSATFRRIVENTVPGQEGESVREVLPHHVFVQVTATPFVLLLQRPDSPLRPGLTHLLEPGEGYRGGEEFFGAFHPAQAVPDPPLVLVPDGESQSLLGRRNAPAGLASSIGFFLLAAAAHAATTQGRFPPGGYKHLAHTSRLTVQHDHVADVIQRHLHALRRLLRDPTSPATRAAFERAYAELQRSQEDIQRLGAVLPPLDDLLRLVADALPQAEVLKVNANTGEPEYGPTLNFVVGGNILGRGITIDELLVTYYLREAQTSQMDTVWQHGRMFGYRAQLMPYTRVFLPRRLAVLFKGIHEAEEDLREVLGELARGQPVPISVVSGSRATRPNALEPNAVRVYRPGTQVFPRYVVSDPVAVGTSNREIREVLVGAGVPLNEPDRRNRFVMAPFATLIELARLAPVRPDDDGRWDTDAVVSVLEALRGSYGDAAMLYSRNFERDEERRLQTGVLSGPEVNLARTHERPVLAMVYNGSADAPNYWYPTLFLPAGMPVQVFNTNP
jgi:hypothetical protein